MTTINVFQTGTAGGGGYYGPNTGNATPNSDGTITIDIRDLPEAMRGGFVPVFTSGKFYAPKTAPAAASATAIVSSTTLSNGALSIAAQPDVPRQLQFVIAPGTTAITAGQLVLVYDASDGTVQTDTLSIVTALSTSITVKSTKGCMHLVSATVANLAGGTSPGIEGGTNATLAVPLEQNAVDTTVFKENLDGTDAATVGTLTTTGLWTPHTAPNATHTYELGYSVVAP